MTISSHFQTPSAAGRSPVKPALDPISLARAPSAGSLGEVVAEAWGLRSGAKLLEARVRKIKAVTPAPISVEF
jgi:hypothetical protein